MHRILFLLSILGIIWTQPVFAQLDNTQLESDISIVSTPSNPQPSEKVVLEIKSYSIDLDQANIAWRYNGTLIASGTGKTKINTVAPNANTPALITATVSGAGITTSSTAINLRTASVDLLWEAADSYTPPFYKGKAMLAPNGVVRLTAIAAANAPKNLSYTWSRNDSVVPTASGYNKNSILFKNQTLNQEERVSVLSEGGFFNGSSNISINTKSPQVVLYQKKDGFIDYSNGYLSNFSTNDPGVIIRLEPYFFSVSKDINSDLVFDIKNNDNPISGGDKNNELSLSRPENTEQSSIDVQITTAIYSLQNILRRFTIMFN